MANRRLSMCKIEEVLRLHFECGRNNREIAKSAQASPTTVEDYLRRAKLAGIGLARALSGHGAEAVRNAIAAKIVQLPEHFTQLTDLATQTV